MPKPSRFLVDRAASPLLGSCGILACGDGSNNNHTNNTYRTYRSTTEFSCFPVSAPAKGSLLTGGITLKVFSFVAFGVDVVLGLGLAGRGRTSDSDDERRFVAALRGGGTQLGFCDAFAMARPSPRNAAEGVLKRLRDRRVEVEDAKRGGVGMPFKAARVCDLQAACPELK